MKFNHSDCLEDSTEGQYQPINPRAISIPHQNLNLKLVTQQYQEVPDIRVDIYSNIKSTTIPNDPHEARFF